MNNFPKQIFWLPIIVITTFFVTLAIYTRFFGAIPLSVNSVSTTKTDLFQTTGEGKVTAQPDIAEINLGITVSQPTIKGAQTEANSVINKVTSEVKKSGVDEKDIKTTSYNLYPDYDYSSGRQNVKGYTVNINMEVKVRDFEKINGVIDSATASGANLIGGLRFTLDDKKLKELRSEAQGLAIKEAKEKAESLAKAAGINLGKIVNIQENANAPFPLRSFAAMEAKPVAEERTQIQPGESEIITTITLSYEIR